MTCGCGLVRRDGPTRVPAGLRPPPPDRAGATLAAELVGLADLPLATLERLARMDPAEAARAVEPLVAPLGRWAAMSVQRAGERLSERHRAGFVQGLAQYVPRMRRANPRLPLRPTGDRDTRKVAPPPDPIDSKATVDRWARKAAADISGASGEAKRAISRDIKRALAEGIPPEKLARKWKREGLPLDRGTTKARLELIARTQIATLQSELHRARSQAVGITHFTWRTQGDAKVRPEHQVRNGRDYLFRRPPGGVLPGQEINCRCWAEDVITPEAIERMAGFLFRAAA